MRSGECSSPAALRSAALPIWHELLHGVEATLLRTSPGYWGFGMPPGDGSAVVVVPAFLSADHDVVEFRAWLDRIGYRAYASGLKWNADCPELLSRRLAATIERVHASAGRVHLVGHSFGGVLARVVAARMPELLSSVITLASPFRGIVAHPAILCAVFGVQCLIHKRRGPGVRRHCLSATCTCEFVSDLTRELPGWLRQIAIYTKLDGVVDWRYCLTGDPAIDRQVPATHSGLMSNPIVYEVIAHHLAAFRSLKTS